MDLVRDLLDKRVVDRHGRDMGRVDSVVMEYRDGAPPQVTAIEIGPAVLAFRVRPMLGRVVAALEYIFGVDEGRPFRIALDDVLDIRDHVKVNVAFGETPAATVEQRLRRWTRAVPEVS